MPGDIPKHAQAARYIDAAAGLEAAEQHAAAAAAYDAAIARWPEEPNAWLGRGNVAYAAGDLERAADLFLHAAQLAPRDPAARNNLAQTLADAGCVSEARGQADRALALARETPLAEAVAETRAKIEGLNARDSACALAGRRWPE
jgi:tetratricopeptide (TPR) repeat protein